MQTRPQLQVAATKTPEISGRRVKFNVLRRIGFTEKQIEKHQASLDLAEKVINSLEFKTKLHAVKKFTSSSSTGVKVYDKILTGEETLQAGKDYEFDMEFTMYESNNSTVGYTYGTKIMVWINNKFFKNYSQGEIAGNTVHEYCHKLGFDHTSNYTDERSKSVPYFVGYLVRDMVDDYVSGKIKLTDLYPEVTPQPHPIPQPVPPVEVIKTKICRRTWWTLWLKTECYYK